MRAEALQLMSPLNNEKQVRAYSLIDPPSLVRVRILACLTALACVVAQIVSQASVGSGNTHDAPPGAVIGQAIWNAAQVGLLLLLLCLCCTSRRRWVVTLTLATVICLPFAIYALSPGAWILTVLLLATCGVAYAQPAPDLSFVISDAPAHGTPAYAKFELLAFTCTLLCSMYNFNLSSGQFPFWSGIFRVVSDIVGLPQDHTVIIKEMYALGLSGVTTPEFIKMGRKVSSLGAVIFATIWTVLPFLYVTYFVTLAKLARQSPATKLQQALCLLCILTFLFLTDIVDYRFGRGLANPVAEWAHWAERFAWHIAILLPIYQKVTTGHWLRGNGIVGVLLHYSVAAYAVGYLMAPVLRDVIRLYHFTTGPEPPDWLPDYGLGAILSYTPALVVMTFVYGVSFLTLRCKRISAFAVTTTPGELRTRF